MEEQEPLTEVEPPVEPPEKAKPAPKAKAERQPGVKKFNKAHPRQCRGCSLWFGQSDMASGSNFDVACKYRVDCIYKIARSQGQMEWYKGVMANDVKLQMVLAEYGARVGDDGKKKLQRRSMTFAMLERTAAKSAVVVRNKGKMMYERQYMAFADTWEGGKLSEAQARHQWLVWKEQAHEPNSEWPAKDLEGPGGELRLWVATEDIVEFQNSVEKSKELQAKGKDLKNATDDDVNKMQRQLHTGHDSLALGFEEAAGQMAKFGGAGAFQASNYQISDVSGLLVPSKDEDTLVEEEKGEDEEMGGEDGSTASKTTTGTKKRWFDYATCLSSFLVYLHFGSLCHLLPMFATAKDRKVSKAQARAKGNSLKFSQDLEWHSQQANIEITACQETIKKHTGPPVEAMQSALNILQGRLEGLTLVRNNDAVGLKSLWQGGRSWDRRPPLLAIWS